MRIAYLIFHDITRNDGITKKVKGQIEEWSQMNSQVRVFCFLPKEGNSILSATQYVYGGYMNMRFVMNKNFIKDIKEFNPQIVYFRYDSWNVNLINSISGRVSIAELNTLDINEYKLLVKTEKSLKSILRYLGYYLGRNTLLKQISAYVGVTEEISMHQSYLKFNKEFITVPNGINLNDFDIVKSSISNLKRISLFFIGTPGQPWHGMDIISAWSERLTEFDFHIVGISGVNTKNLFYHGYLVKSEYLKVLNKCHICIGSLALYRNSMEEACPLKVREYLAYGFPIIIGYKDTSFLLNEAKFILSLEKDDLFNYDKIKSFIYEMKSNIVSRDNIQVISTKNLENQRFNFMSNLYNKTL